MPGERGPEVRVCTDKRSWSKKTLGIATPQELTWISYQSQTLALVINEENQLLIRDHVTQGGRLIKTFEPNIEEEDMVEKNSGHCGPPKRDMGYLSKPNLLLFSYL